MLKIRYPDLRFMVADAKDLSFLSRFSIDTEAQIFDDQSPKLLLPDPRLRNICGIPCVKLFNYARSWASEFFDFLEIFT